MLNQSLLLSLVIILTWTIRNPNFIGSVDSILVEHYNFLSKKILNFHRTMKRGSVVEYWDEVWQEDVKCENQKSNLKWRNGVIWLLSVGVEEVITLEFHAHSCTRTQLYTLYGNPENYSGLSFVYSYLVVKDDTTFTCIRFITDATLYKWREIVMCCSRGTIKYVVTLGTSSSLFNQLIIQESSSD